MNNEIWTSVEGKRILKWASWAVLMLVIFLGVTTLGAFKGLRSVDPGYNSISVTGEGEAVSIPDIATFSFSVSADANAVSDAQNAVTKKMDTIIAAMKNLGIDEKDINTTDYSVYPKYRYVTSSMPCGPNYCPPSSSQVLDGYTASHTLTIKVRNTENAGKALAAAGENGATNISSINFTSDDPSAVLAEARAKAIADAKAKAKVLAKELDVRIVRVVSFEDNVNNRQPQPYAVSLQDAKAGSAESAPSIPIGQNKTSVSVTVTYEIR